MSIAAGNQTVSWAHGLGAIPGFFDVRLHCISGEAGYTIGQEVPLNLFDQGGTIYMVYADATNVYVAYNGQFTVGNPGTFGLTTITLSKWNLVFRASL